MRRYGLRGRLNANFWKMAVEAGISSSDIRKLVGKLRFWNIKKKKAIVAYLRIAARELQADARERVPVKTGRLRASIQVLPERKRGLLQRVGTNVKYAPHVEFGTSTQEAQPYIYPAYRAMVPKIVKRLEQIIIG